jgi:hypothetical protein
MSYKDKGGNPSKPQEENKNQEKKQHVKRFQKTANRTKFSEEILKWNYDFVQIYLFCEVLSKKALNKYGNLGKLIKQGKYYQPPEPQRDECCSLNPTVNVDGLPKVHT